MRKSVLIILPAAMLILVLSSISRAQPVVVGEPWELIPASERIWLHPVWSPDGKYIAFSSEKHKGLWVAMADGSGLRQISDRDGVGFGFSWSSDGKTLLARASGYINDLRHQWIEIIHAETGESHAMTKPQRGIQGLPLWTHQDLHLGVVIDGRIQWIESGKAPLAVPIERPETPVAFSIEGKVLEGSTDNIDIRVMADFGDNAIFNVVKSPDGSRLAFQVSAQGLFVMNTDGTGLKQIGRGERPRWTPDGKYLIVMITKDDGYQITQSDLFAVDPQTGQEFLLTANTDIIAMSPSVSPDGKKIAFENHESGSIYVINIQ